MLSKVNFFVSKMHEPCKVSERDWYITIFNCDGTLLEFCGRDYIVIKAPCGHAEIRLPPGKYYALGVWSYWKTDSGYWGNHFTSKTIFQVDSGRHICCWLYNPSVHECGIIWQRAGQGMQQNLNAAEADLIAAGVDTGDPRFQQIADMRAALDANLPAVQALNQQLDSFFDVFVENIIEPGMDFRRDELMGIDPDPAMMEDKVMKNSEPVGDDFKLTAEIKGTLAD